MTEGGRSTLFLIEARRAEVVEACRRFGVRRLEIFGSAVTGDFDPGQSDLDFLADFGDEGPERALDAYFGLKESLEEIFGRPVDLTMPVAITNPYFRAEMERSRKVLYGA